MISEDLLNQIKSDTILSSYDEKITLLKWLKEVVSSFEIGNVSKIEELTNAEGKNYIKITFNSGNTIESEAFFAKGVLDEYIAYNAENATLEVGTKAEIDGDAKLNAGLYVDGDASVEGSIATHGDLVMAGALKDSSGNDLLAKKQDKLTAGTNITIKNSVISASGSSSYLHKITLITSEYRLYFSMLAKTSVAFSIDKFISYCFSKISSEENPYYIALLGGDIYPKASSKYYPLNALYITLDKEISGVYDTLSNFVNITSFSASNVTSFNDVVNEI